MPHLQPGLVEGHFGYFHVLATVNDAATNTGAHTSLRTGVSNFSGRHPEEGLIAGSYGSSRLNFFEKPPYGFPEWRAAPFCPEAA